MYRYTGTGVPLQAYLSDIPVGGNPLNVLVPNPVSLGVPFSHVPVHALLPETSVPDSS